MGDPVTIAVLGGLQAVSSIQQGKAQAAQYKTQAASMDLEAKAAETNAAIEEAQRRERLREVLSSQKAQMAAAGVSSSSISGRVLEEASTNKMMQEQRIANLSTSTSSAINRLNISGAKKAATSAVIGGWLGGASSAGTTGYNIYKTSIPKTPSPNPAPKKKV